MDVLLRISLPAVLSGIGSYSDGLIAYVWARRVGTDPEHMQIDAAHTGLADRL